MENILRIGDFSKINHISIQTLRFYDQIGLLKPYKVDDQTNYRYYHINQSALVDLIQYLRQLNFSLRDIKVILTKDDFTDVSLIIEEHRQALKGERTTINQQLRELDDFQKSIQLYQQRKVYPSLELLELPARQILSYEVEENIYQMSTEEYELYLRYFKDLIQDYFPFFNSFGRVGSIILERHFKSGNWVSHELFVFPQDMVVLPSTQLKEIPAGLYAVSYCDSFQEEKAALSVFLKAIQNANYHICGDYICEVIYEHSNLSDSERRMFIRMQVPVKTI